MEPLAIYWLCAGLVMMFLELLIPGLVVVFVGLAAVLVSVLIHFQVVQTTVAIFFTFIAASIFFVFTLRVLVAKLLPSQTEVGNMDEDQDAIGRVVQVVKDIGPPDGVGRISYRGTTWTAKCLVAKTLPEGSQVRLLKREIDVWIVEPIEEIKNI